MFSYNLPCVRTFIEGNQEVDFCNEEEKIGKRTRTECLLWTRHSLCNVFYTLIAKNQLSLHNQILTRLPKASENTMNDASMKKKSFDMFLTPLTVPT